MIITISGYPGSGKNTVAEMLADRLSYKYAVMGDIRRKIAEERGISLAELNRQDEKTGETDKIVDNKLKKIGKEEDNMIAVGRIAYHFIPDSFKVFLDVSVEEGARRIALQARADEKYKDVDYGIRKIKERNASDLKRYKKLYGIKYDDKKNYDIWVDTNQVSAEQVAEIVLNGLRKFKKR